MKTPLSPTIRWQAAGTDVVTIASVTTPGGTLRLIGLASSGCHYVADQAADGTLVLMAGPVSPGHALDLATRVLAGTARTVSDTGLVLASALVLAGAVAELGGCAAPGEVPA